MPLHLRLHRDEPEAPQPPIPATYRFPAAMAVARKRLVAGTVHGSTRSDDVVRGVEHALDHIQDRLNRLKRDSDVIFKFPDPDEPDRPRAA